MLKDQVLYDRLDLMVRIFKLKVDALLNDVLTNKIFGECEAHTYTIEFQKRGAPHIHFLFWIKDFVESPENIDQYISAEIPDPKKQPELYELVCTKMLHGPCGCVNPNLMCMKDKKRRMFKKLSTCLV